MGLLYFFILYRNYFRFGMFQLVIITRLRAGIGMPRNRGSMLDRDARFLSPHVVQKDSGVHPATCPAGSRENSFPRGKGVMPGDLSVTCI